MYISINSISFSLYFLNFKNLTRMSHKLSHYFARRITRPSLFIFSTRSSRARENERSNEEMVADGASITDCHNLSRFGQVSHSNQIRVRQRFASHWPARDRHLECLQNHGPQWKRYFYKNFNQKDQILSETLAFFVIKEIKFYEDRNF